MRKIGLGLLIIVFIVVVVLNLKEDKEIRVRIIPNSDLTCDLEVKEKAKEITICYLKEAFDEDYEDRKSVV